MSPFTMPGWIGLVDAAGVVVAFGVWLFVVDERWAFLRPAVGVTGVLLLVIQVAQRMSALTTTSFTLWSPFFRENDSGDPLLAILLLTGGAVLGLVAATHGPGPDDVPEAEEEEVEAEEREPAYAAPARAWSSTEVLGDAPHHDGAPPPPPEPRLRVAPLLSRGVAVPLLALALALALPVQSITEARSEPVHAPVHLAHYVLHGLTGLMLGLALLGAAVWLDIWERWLVAVAFALVAAGSVVEAAWPVTLSNENWIYFASGLGAGLAAPALLRVLRRLRAPGRLPLVAGSAVALLLVAGLGYATMRVVYSGYFRFSSTAVEGSDGG
jgi:hypothetical protein